MSRSRVDPPPSFGFPLPTVQKPSDPQSQPPRTQSGHPAPAPAPHPPTTTTAPSTPGMAGLDRFLAQWIGPAPSADQLGNSDELRMKVEKEFALTHDFVCSVKSEELPLVAEKLLLGTALLSHATALLETGSSLAFISVNVITVLLTPGFPSLFHFVVNNSTALGFLAEAGRCHDRLLLEALSSFWRVLVLLQPAPGSLAVPLFDAAGESLIWTLLARFSALPNGRATVAALVHAFTEHPTTILMLQNRSELVDRYMTGTASEKHWLMVRNLRLSVRG
jgi:hypothetical protein